MSALNDPEATPDHRLAALREARDDATFPGFVNESNNHVHTMYSFSPYTPAMAAWRAREAGLPVVGSVDHDSLAAAAEMRAAAASLGMGAVTGCEIRVFAHSAAEVSAGRAPLANRKLNNPDSVGIMYLTIQAVPARSRAKLESFLAPARAARLARTRQMADDINAICALRHLPQLDFTTDVVARSQYDSGGTITERHLLAGLASKLIETWGPGPAIVDGLSSLGIDVDGQLLAQLADPANPHLAYDLLGVMKAEFLAQVYRQPQRVADGGECYDAADVATWAEQAGAIACYAYLGDVTASATGDKKAEHFEDGYLDELFDELARLGLRAVTYMPPRNTPEQLARVGELARHHHMLEVSGVDINSSRQQFNCPELQQLELAHLNEATWALVAHEVLSDHDPALGLLVGDNIQRLTTCYAPLGRALAGGAYPAAVVAAARAGRTWLAGTTADVKGSR